MAQTQNDTTTKLVNKDLLADYHDALMKKDILPTPDFEEEGLTQELEDEYTRVMAALYQALTDTGVQITAAQAAAALAQAKATLANNAAATANTAASNADSKAAYAKDQGDYAKAKADEIEDAKGNFNTLDARLDNIEANAGDVTFEEDTTGGFDF